MTFTGFCSSIVRGKSRIIFTLNLDELCIYYILYTIIYVDDCWTSLFLPQKSNNTKIQSNVYITLKDIAF